MTKSLDHRRDVRDVETFAHNIKDYTEREHIWSIALRIYFGETGNPCNVEDYGVDGSGELIETKLSNYNADKLFKFVDKTLQIEIKTVPEWLTKFFTFKTFCLKECVKQKAFIVVPRMDHFYWFSTESIEKILKYPSKIYHGFSSTDLAVRIFMDSVEGLIKDKLVFRNKWKPKSKEYILKNKEVLLRDKK